MRSKKDRRSSRNESPPLWFGLIFILAGSFVAAMGTGWIPVDPESIHAPRWVRVMGLAAVVMLGGAMALGLKDQLVRLKRDKHLTAADAEKSMQTRNH